MLNTVETRKSSLSVIYNSTNISEEIKADLKSFSFSDSIESKSNELNITLNDSSFKWRSAWFPKPGSYILANITVENWTADIKTSTLKCGKFYLDSPEVSKDGFTIKGISTPYSSSVKSTKNTRSWQKITLKSLAGDIAGRNGLVLFYDFDDTIFFNKITQSNKTDIAFISDLAKQFGGSTKLENDKIIIFDKSKYAEKPPVAILDTEKWIIDYSFSIEDQDNKESATVSKHKTDDKKTSSSTASKKKGNGKVKNNTKLDLDKNSENKLAEATLKKSSGKIYKGSLTVMGNPSLYAGATINITGDFAGVWKGKYLIEKITHEVGSSGYTSNLDLRRY